MPFIFSPTLHVQFALIMTATEFYAPRSIGRTIGGSFEPFLAIAAHRRDPRRGRNLQSSPVQSHCISLTDFELECVKLWQISDDLDALQAVVLDWVRDLDPTTVDDSGLK